MPRLADCGIPPKLGTVLDTTQQSLICILIFHFTNELNANQKLYHFLQTSPPTYWNPMSNLEMLEMASLKAQFLTVERHTQVALTDIPIIMCSPN